MSTKRELNRQGEILARFKQDARANVIEADTPQELLSEIIQKLDKLIANYEIERMAAITKKELYGVEMCLTAVSKVRNGLANTVIKPRT